MIRASALMAKAPIEKLGAYKDLMPLCAEIGNALLSDENEMREKLIHQTLSRACDILDHLSGGFHAFDRKEKAARYQEARAAVAGTAARLRLLSFLQPAQAGTLEGLARRLEENLKSVSGLVRAMERGRPLIPVRKYDFIFSR